MGGTVATPEKVHKALSCVTAEQLTSEPVVPQ